MRVKDNAIEAERSPRKTTANTAPLLMIRSATDMLCGLGRILNGTDMIEQPQQERSHLPQAGSSKCPGSLSQRTILPGCFNKGLDRRCHKQDLYRIQSINSTSPASRLPPSLPQSENPSNALHLRSGSYHFIIGSGLNGRFQNSFFVILTRLSWNPRFSIVSCTRRTSAFSSPNRRKPFVASTQSPRRITSTSLGKSFGHLLNRW